MKVRRLFLNGLLSLGAIFLLASCAGGSFNRQWDASVAEFESGSAESPIAGPWIGSWKSHVNGHEGELRCLVVEATDGDPARGSEAYEFRYHATWGDFFSGGYTARHAVTPDGPRGYHVKGSKKLGAFGTFDHEGWIQGDRFESTYASEQGDHGVFDLARPN